MYMNCAFDATLRDRKWLYILQGHFLNRLKIIAKCNENQHFTQMAMDFYKWLEYETFFLQLLSSGWTCKDSIDLQVSYNNMT